MRLPEIARHPDRGRTMKRKLCSAELTSDGRAMLNLACGDRIHNEWTNIEYSKSLGALMDKHPLLTRTFHRVGLISNESFEHHKHIGKELLYADLNEGIPFEDGTFDVIYHSHFIEHLDRKQALAFLRECHRVLKRGGIIRVVTPDLEMAAANYLTALKDLENGSGSKEAYDWAMLELFDQFVRTEPGGDMKFLLQEGISAARDHVETEIPEAEPGRSGSLRRKIVTTWKKATGRLDPQRLGELHRWFYDRYSLKTLLTLAGFKEVWVCDAHSGRIEDWSMFALDADPDGTLYKPGSLYMEASK